jgi:hypothetical protein
VPAVGERNLTQAAAARKPGGLLPLAVTAPHSQSLSVVSSSGAPDMQLKLHLIATRFDTALPRCRCRVYKLTSSSTTAQPPA